MDPQLSTILWLQREADRANRVLMTFEDSPTARIIQEAQHASLLQQELLRKIDSPLRGELDRHRRMMDEIKAARIKIPESLRLPQLNLTNSVRELLVNQQVLHEMKALSRPLLAVDLQRILPANPIWQHIHEQQVAFESVRIHAAIASQSFRDIAWAQQIVTRPSLYVVEHVNETANLITRWEQLGRPVGSLAASIACAESQAISQENEILAYPDVFEYEQIELEETQDNAFLPSHNLYFAQRTELIYVARNNPNFLQDENLLDGLGTMQYFNCAQAVCHLVSEINRLCNATGRDRIFKLTEQLMQSLVALPNIYAVRRSHFCEFLDHMYFIIYEGAGASNLRFLALITDEDAAPVWMLKHLRNLYARHDREHGSDGDIKKKHEHLRDIFVELIGRPQPQVRSDFTSAQLMFLRRIEEMLRVIYKKIEEEMPK